MSSNLKITKQLKIKFPRHDPECEKLDYYYCEYPEGTIRLRRPRGHYKFIDPETGKLYKDLKYLGIPYPA